MLLTPPPARRAVAAAALCAVLAVTACSGAPGSGATPSADPGPQGDPAVFLPRLEDLPVPGFAIQEPPAPVDAAAIAAGDPVRAGRLTAAGLVAAERVRYFRAVPDLAGSSGPVDVVCTVERYPSAAAAATALAAQGEWADGAAGATPLSPGPLGTDPHADLLTATSGSVPVAQTTLLWRTGALVTALVVRERLAGSPLAHALRVAAPVVGREGGATPGP